ncbi:MAG: hypothetical protein ACRC35_00855, partial [Angustibacter sp.]
PAATVGPRHVTIVPHAGGLVASSPRDPADEQASRMAIGLTASHRTPGYIVSVAPQIAAPQVAAAPQAVPVAGGAPLRTKAASDSSPPAGALCDW